MTEYTPTTEQVRDAYVRAMRNAFVASAGEHAAEFGRWLAEHDADVAAKALEDAAEAGWDSVDGCTTPYIAPGVADWLFERAAALRASTGGENRG